MSLVRGENLVGYTYDDGVWKPHVCARTIDITESTAYLKTSVAGAGANETIEPTEHSATATIDGLVSLNVSGSLSLSEIRQMQRARQKILTRYQMTAEDGTVYTEEAYWIITSSRYGGSYDGMVTYSVEMRRTGGGTIVTIPTTSITTNKVKRYPAIDDSLNMAGGETYFESALLENKDILEVVKDGLGQAKIILSGTPVNKEVLYTPSVGGLGRLEFAVPFDPGEEGYVLFQDI